MENPNIPASESLILQEEEYDEDYVELICSGWRIDLEPQEDEPAVVNARHLNANLRRTASCSFSIASSGCQSSILRRPRTRVITSCDVKDLIGLAAFYDVQLASRSTSSLVSGPLVASDA
jgi:hypothetical protein